MFAPPRPARPYARAWIAASVGLGLLAAALGGVAWHYSEMIVGAPPPSPLREQRVFAADAGSVRLTRDPESLEPGVWALQWEDGFGRIGRVLDSDDSSVVREFKAMVGAPPVGGWASLRGVSRSADPRTMLGLDYHTVAVAGALGTCPAWFVPGPDSTWVVYVHGWGANRSEALRTLGVLHARGLPGLLVSYRNDPGAAPSPDGLSHLGLTEWEDLDAAARYALAHGARDLVIAAYSMGGQIAMQYMARSPTAGRAVGLVLEAPLLDWNATLDHRARRLGVFPFVTGLGKWAAARRAGLDWEQLDRVAHPDGPAVPILLFHGLHDDFVPEASSEAFARALPGRVTLIRVEGGDHVEAWNTDPPRYAATLHAWCAARGIGRDPR